MKRATAAIVFIIVLCLNVCFANEEAAYASKQAILNISLYKILPNYD